MRKKINMGPKELTRDSKTFVPDVERVFHEGSILECLTHEGLFSPDECAALLNLYGNDDRFFVDAGANKGKVQFIEADEVSMFIYEKILALVTSANDTHYHFDINHFDAIQLGKYETGCYYNDHIDIGPGRMGNRKLSLTIQLSDPDTYEGGDLIISDLENFHASRAVGSVTVFPSFLKHRVTEVTKGTRYSIAAWAGGKHRFK